MHAVKAEVQLDLLHWLYIRDVKSGALYQTRSAIALLSSDVQSADPAHQDSGLMVLNRNTVEISLFLSYAVQVQPFRALPPSYKNSAHQIFFMVWALA